MPKVHKELPNSRKFAQSGHPGSIEQREKDGGTNSNIGTSSGADPTTSEFAVTKARSFLHRRKVIFILKTRYDIR
jgi:hypothetical protein